MPLPPIASAAIAIPHDATTRTNCCETWWTGLRTAHCTACHQTFTSITGFDMHRDGRHADDTRHCRPPQEAGLVDAGRDYPCWGRPRSASWNPQASRAHEARPPRCTDGR